MATEESHIAAANRNQGALEHLCLDIECFAPWVVTVAFYKALHIVDAVLSHDGIRVYDHSSRLSALRRENKLKYIYKHFSPLYRISQVARYLEDVETFEDKYSNVGEAVRDSLFNRLRNIETSSKKFISNPDNLSSVDECRELYESFKKNKNS